MCVCDGGVLGGGRAQQVSAVSNPILHMTPGDARQHLLFFGEARSGIKRVFERLLGMNVSYPTRPYAPKVPPRPLYGSTV